MNQFYLIDQSIIICEINLRICYQFYIQLNPINKFFCKCPKSLSIMGL